MRRQMTETYIAEHLWLATGVLYAFAKNELKTPRYTEIVNPTLNKTDKRTAKEIVADIRKKLGWR